MLRCCLPPAACQQMAVGHGSHCCPNHPAIAVGAQLAISPTVHGVPTAVVAVPSLHAADAGCAVKQQALLLYWGLPKCCPAAVLTTAVLCGPQCKKQRLSPEFLPPELCGDREALLLLLPHWSGYYYVLLAIEQLPGWRQTLL